MCSVSAGYDDVWAPCIKSTMASLIILRLSSKFVTFFKLLIKSFCVCKAAPCNALVCFTVSKNSFCALFFSKSVNNSSFLSWELLAIKAR